MRIAILQIIGTFSSGRSNPYWILLVIALTADACGKEESDTADGGTDETGDTGGDMDPDVDVYAVMKTRRSVRSYLDKEIPENGLYRAQRLSPPPLVETIQ